MNVGERVGDYEIVEVLGAGGMGKVYKVRNVLSDRVEAMKVLLPNLEGDRGLADRFLREIKVQAALDHPNIARLHTAQVYQNQLLMVMEFVEGSTIEKMLGQGAIGVRDAVEYTRQVLSALDYAHARGVVHRDIKPANIMRTPQGVIKLMDFGIARMQTDRRLTQTGTTVGSLFYMSPEQIKGGQPDPRSDLYSLGITLYEMVTGRRPFDATSDFAIMAAHLQQQPRAPIEVIPGIPQVLSDIILMAIAKEPEQRFQSAQAFKGALESMFSPGPGVAKTAVLPGPPAPPPMMAPPPVARPQAPPQAFAPPPPMYPPPTTRKPVSLRGLYMTLGSLATVGVIALGIVMVPRFMRTGATGNGTVIPTGSTGSSVPSGATSSGTPPANTTQQLPPPSNPPPNGGSTSAPAIPPATPPNSPPVSRPQQQTPQQQKAPSSTPAVVPVKVQPVSTQPNNVVATPAPQVSQPVQQQAPPPQQQQPPSARPAVVQASPELNELRDLYNLISVRVSSAKTGLRSLQQQQSRQGLNLRGDIVEAESRMDYLMKEAMDSIRAGDAANGRRNLQMAERALEQIEKFLGR